MDNTETTERTLRSYFHAWTTGDRETMASLLGRDLRFYFVSAGVDSVQGRDAFLAGEAWPKNVQVTLLDEAYQHDTGFQMYRVQRAEQEITVVEKFTVRGEQIGEIWFLTDARAYADFRAAFAS